MARLTELLCFRACTPSTDRNYVTGSEQQSAKAKRYSMAGAAFEAPKDNRSEAGSEEESDASSSEASAAGVPPPDQDGHADSAEEEEREEQQGGRGAEEGGGEVKGVEGGSPAEARQGQEKVIRPLLSWRQRIIPRRAVTSRGWTRQIMEARLREGGAPVGGWGVA